MTIAGGAPPDLMAHIERNGLILITYIHCVQVKEWPSVLYESPAFETSCGMRRVDHEAYSLVPGSRFGTALFHALVTLPSTISQELQIEQLNMNFELLKILLYSVLIKISRDFGSVL